MACLRNLAIGVLSQARPVNLAAALRHHARDPARPLATRGSSRDEPDITRDAGALPPLCWAPEKPGLAPGLE